MMAATGASAQVSTSTLRGAITDGGAAEAGATVVARDVNSGFTYRGTTNETGAYVVSGLRPGTYELTVTTADGQSATDTVIVGVGQVGYVDLDVSTTTDVAAVPGSDEATELDEIVVVGRRLAEVRTPEIATNVTQQQINTLPQINRNFLNFAALAPGVRVSQNESEQTITAGGQRAESVNAFIDGASQKSNIIDGGIAGQDDSRGNPFPQAAIGEFRIVTQNFKAEYEQASSAIITAVTRSGTNDFEGEIFGAYRDESFIEQDVFAKRRGDEQAPLEVRQYGGLLAGPIIPDRLHFLVTYERKDEARAATVIPGVTDPDTLARFDEFLGTFAVPFEEDLYFGKLSFQPMEGHLMDLSVTYRDEFDTRGIGGVDTVERRSQLNQTTKAANFRYQIQGEGWLNELGVDWREYNYNPSAVNFSDFGQLINVFEQDEDAEEPGFQFNPFGGRRVLNIGGADSRQDIVDETITIRNDLTFNDIEFNGYHTIKMGVKFSKQDYQVIKEFGRNPTFYFDLDGRPEITGSADIPYRVSLGEAFPTVDLTNNVYGFYIQDDWQVTDKLELNLGLRWDYEDNANNQDYVTPQAVIDGLDQWIASTDGGKAAGYVPSWFDRTEYFGTGDNRDPFANAWQPRIGFSYDVFGDRSTVIFGGAGRYYDRVQFNFSFDELVKPFDFRKEAFFTTNGGGAPGEATGAADDPFAWDPSYLTVDGLDALLQAVPARGEVFLLKNEFEPPRTDQFNLGVRQRLGEWQTEFTLAYGKTENEFTWQYLNRCREPQFGNDGGGFGDSGGFCGPSGANPYRSYLVSDHNKEREFKALYVKLDKPYTQDSGWGVNIAYTYSDSTQNGGNDNFCFDCFSIETSPERPSANDERHRIVANGIVDLPLDFQLSGILTLGSGTPFDVFDGTGSQFYFRPYAGRPDQYTFLIPDAWAYRNLDLRLTKNFEVWGGSELSVYVDAINVFNFDNFTAYDGGTGSADNPNPRFGMPNGVLFPTRQFQIGARYRF
ncbi:TonB-dependent receptor [Brevundimonas lutea]|uniref:TonB-dependent receptor n=1 Tax=Brevundimonas lutea TaxID=2293980 RepID=UPI001F0C6BFE|nr:carboxypeptidase regulatory-like domain-containing protein [Brevundimonas lutea]